jgi:hypothetical protein
MSTSLSIVVHVGKSIETTKLLKRVSIVVLQRFSLTNTDVKRFEETDHQD